jgi:hypothetical protein
MKMGDVRKKAKDMGVRAVGKKVELVRAIQSAEGNQPCYRTRDACDQAGCCWMDDCLPTSGRA